MRLWTDGTTTVLACPKGVIRWRRGEDVVVRPLEPAYSDYERDGMLAVTPSGVDRTEAKRSSGAIEAGFLDEDRAVAVIARDQRLVLVSDPRGSLEIPLHDIEPRRVAWPKGFKPTKDDGEPVRRGIPFEGRTKLTTNRWGIAVTSNTSGMAVLVRPGAAATGLAVQLPWESATVDAMATELGMLVTYVIQGRESTLFHLAENGKIIARRNAYGAPPALVTDAGFVFRDEDKGQIELVDHRFATIAKEALDLSGGDSAVSPDGRAFAFADDASIAVGRVSGSQITDIEIVEYADALRTQKRRRDVEVSEARYDGKRVSGAAAIGFATGPQSAWRAVAGEAFELTLGCRSVGGAGRGVRVAVSGAALPRISLEHMRIHDRSIAFVRKPDGSYVADCADLELAEGIVYPFDPKPKNDAQTRAAARALADSEFEVRLHGRALEASSDLLAVSIAVIGSTGAPVKWMRPLTIAAH